MLMNLSIIISGLLLAAYPTDPSLTLWVDAHYSISHDWRHVFKCKVRGVISGELDDTLIYLSVYGPAPLYGDLLLLFKNYHQDLKLVFEFNQNRKHGPPSGFRNSEGYYWELERIMPLSPLSHVPTLTYYFLEWGDFEGKASVYRYAEFPDLRYSKPDPEGWIRDLERGGTRDSTTGYVQIWNEDGKVRFIWVTNPYPHGGRFYCFCGDTVDATTPVNPAGQLFSTEVGIYKWRYIYDKGLLAKIVYYRYDIISPMWAIDRVEYWPGSDIPRYIYRYKEPVGLDISESGWDTRTVHDQQGKILRKENPEGQVLWEKKT